MIDLTAAGTYKLGDRAVRRMGYGAMQLAGPHVFGPQQDRAAGGRRSRSRWRGCWPARRTSC